MGCDIHLCVEALTPDGWRNCSAAVLPKRDWKAPPHPRDRCYDLFARLAGVRGYDDARGAIADGRGLPGDWDRAGQLAYDTAVEIVAARQNGHEVYPGDDWIGDHSFGWATLAELLAADWTITVTRARHGERPAEGWPVEEVDLTSSGFVQWLFSPEMLALAVAAGGTDRVRIVWGFDS